jgi:hypothetical protein
MPSKLKPLAFAKPANAGEKLKANTINPTNKDFKTVFIAPFSPFIDMDILVEPIDELNRLGKC